MIQVLHLIHEWAERDDGVDPEYAPSWVGKRYDIEEKGRALSVEQRLAWRQQKAGCPS